MSKWRKSNQTWQQKNRLRRQEINRLHRERVARLLWEIKAASPCKCGASHPACLQFHHKDPSQKEAAVANAAKLGWSITRILREVAKCEIICSNCHLIHHHDERKLAQVDSNHHLPH